MGRPTIGPWSNGMGIGDRRIMERGVHGPIWPNSHSEAPKKAKKLDTRNATENEDPFNLSYPMALRFHAALIFFGASEASVGPFFLVFWAP